jgi:hypothetical protein
MDFNGENELEKCNAISIMSSTMHIVFIFMKSVVFVSVKRNKYEDPL